jgi:hypothetical protein
MSISSQAALTHLRTIKPNDGWSVQKEEGKGFRLLRRNVPLSDNHFQDIHYCPTHNIVVGVLTSDGSTCQVLVDKQGKPATAVRVVSVSSYDPKSRNQASADAPAATRATRSTAASPPAEPLLPNLTPEQNKQLVQYALMVIGGLMVLKILANANLAGLYLLALPLLYLYAVQTCPTIQSFDAKKELKRVLRGQHLPENHPNKPKGFLEEMAARVTASVTAELATFPGYELEMTSLGGAARLADVRVPTANTQCYWVGAFNRWYYVTSFENQQERRTQ